MLAKRKTVQISQEIWDKLDKLSRTSGMSYKDIISAAIGIESQNQKSFNKSAIGDALNTPLWKNVISSVEQGKLGKRSNIAKPDFLIIDTSILTIWRVAPKPAIKDRGTIKLRVMAKLVLGWHELYPKFTLNMEQHLSPLELAFATRLRALVTAGFLINKDKGSYAIGKIKSSEWALIESIESIKPTRGISTHYGISSLLAKR